MTPHELFLRIVVIVLVLAVYNICKERDDLTLVVTAIHNNTHEIKPVEVNKPTLILHVGPKKTATTFIQTTILKNKKIVEALKEDNITIVRGFTYIQMQSLSRLCLSAQINSTHCENERLWEQYIRAFKLEMAEAENQNVFFHTSEEYSVFPNNSFTVQRLRSLEEYFNIEVMLFYRRPAGWFPSMYYQYRKSEMYLSKKRKYRKFRPPMPLTFSEYFERKTDITERGGEDDDGRNSMDVASYFQHIFPDKVQILDFHVPSIGVEFACNGLSTPKTCVIAKDLAMEEEEEKKNTNSIFLFDEDLVVSQAFEQNFFHPDEKVRIDRHTATLKLQSYLDEFKIRDRLSYTCLTPLQEEWLWNTTLRMEEFILQYNYNYSTKSEGELRDQIHIESKKFCHLDAKTALRDREVKSFLESCAFIQENVNATTNDGRTCEYPLIPPLISPDIGE